MANPALLPSADRPRDPSQRSPYRAAAERWLGPVAIAAAAAAMLWRTWGAWPDPLIDFGRELYVPWQLTAGKVLYRDIAYLNGPLSPYLNALWFKLCGVGLWTLVRVNAAIWVLILWMFYRILVEIGGRFSATVACLTFVTIFSFGQYGAGFGNYNYLCPYSHELTHGLGLCVAAILCVHRFTKRPHARYVGIAGLLLGLVFLTKAEVFVVGTATIVSGLGLALWTERAAPARVCRLAACLIAGGMAPLVISCVLFSQAMSVSEAILATLGSCRYVFNREVAGLLFYRVGMGLDDPLRRILSIAGVTSGYAVILLPAALVALRLARARRGIRIAAAAALFMIVAGVLGASFRPSVFLAAGQPLSLFMLALAVVLVLRFVRTPPERHQASRMILQIMMVVFALTLLLKMVLNGRVYQYGFVLAMPAVLLLVVVLIDWAPAYLTKRGGYGLVFTSAALAGIIVTIWAHLRLIDAIVESKVTTIASGVDSFVAASRGPTVNWALEQVEQRIAADQTLMVVPEGVMINYLSRRENPTPYINFMPPEIILFNERAILTAMRSRQPDYVLVVHKDTDEYGFRFFGQDYGQEIFAWIESNYRPVSSIGAPPLTDGRFGMVMMRRVDRN